MAILGSSRLLQRSEIEFISADLVGLYLIKMAFNFTENEECRFWKIVRSSALIGEYIDQEDIVEWYIEISEESEIICKLAAAHGKIEVIKKLRETGHRMNTELVLSKAAKHGHLEIIKFLKEDGCQMPPYIVKRAAVRGHFEIVKWLIENGSSYDMEDMKRYFGRWLMTFTP